AQKCAQPVRSSTQLLGCEVRVALHHQLRLPRAELLQLRNRGAGYDVPRGPDVPQVVPAEVLDASALQRVAPRSRVHLTERPISHPTQTLGLRWRTRPLTAIAR